MTKNSFLNIKRKTLIRILAGSSAAIAVGFLMFYWNQERWPPLMYETTGTPAPLIMQGGDPYIRALMRTISASESNVAYPYSVLYGGKYVKDLSQHPDRCVKIITGPNQGNCTTAAGRYQMLTTTWYETAKYYHPKPSKILFWESYSFEPQFQDAVVYAWLNDPTAWGVNIGQLLREGQIEKVLRVLSGTWTSLGYGIEDNSMTAYLPEIYKEILLEELQAAKKTSKTL